jgi:hypothetical protein
VCQVDIRYDFHHTTRNTKDYFLTIFKVDRFCQDQYDFHHITTNAKCYYLTVFKITSTDNMYEYMIQGVKCFFFISSFSSMPDVAKGSLEQVLVHSFRGDPQSLRIKLLR